VILTKEHEAVSSYDLCEILVPIRGCCSDRRNVHNDHVRFTTTAKLGIAREYRLLRNEVAEERDKAGCCSQAEMSQSSGKKCVGAKELAPASFPGQHHTRTNSD